ncbi:uncharacterized protein LOC143227160 [Tachypleus tridentatus]|uniref:uncharacterized protein LOC143227160 n=1 Tax=Tachypleus tridentatus TaxID=6853 RepID=UPI003FD0CEC6
MNHLCSAVFGTTRILLYAWLLDASRGERNECEYPWSGDSEACFFFSETMKSFDEAKLDCHNRGGSLATIENVHQLKWIIRGVQTLGANFQPLQWLIGLYQYDDNDNNKYRWLDGSSSSFRYWMSSQPNNQYERCVQMDGSANFKWRDALCNKRSLFICKKSLKNGQKIIKHSKPTTMKINNRKISTNKNVTAVNATEATTGWKTSNKRTTSNKWTTIQDRKKHKTSTINNLIIRKDGEKYRKTTTSYWKTTTYGMETSMNYEKTKVNNWKGTKPRWKPTTYVMETSINYEKTKRSNWKVTRPDWKMTTYRLSGRRFS